MNDFVIKFEDLNFKINPPIDIEKITKTIDSKKLEFTIKESTDTVIYENFMKWKNIIAEQNNNCFNDVVIRKFTKPYPYKSKRKRLVKKWWKNHSELIKLHNVKIEPNIK